MIDPVDAYLEVQQRLIGVMLEGEDHLALPVRSCPGWSVHDTFAHLVGAVTDGVTGNLPELVGVDFFADWDRTLQLLAMMSARQVKEREHHDIAALVDEWERSTAIGVPMMRGEVPYPDPCPPIAGALAINDVVVHEGDIRQALGQHAAPPTRALSLAVDNYALLADLKIRSAGIPPLLLVSEGGQKLLGEGSASAELHADLHTLVRILASRRSPEQIVALDWRGDPTQYVDILPAYGPVATDDADIS